MNPENGIVCSAFYRDGNKKKKKKTSNTNSNLIDEEGPITSGSQDNELVLLSR